MNLKYNEACFDELVRTGYIGYMQMTSRSAWLERATNEDSKYGE